MKLRHSLILLAALTVATGAYAVDASQGGASATGVMASRAGAANAGTMGDSKGLKAGAGDQSGAAVARKEGTSHTKATYRKDGTLKSVDSTSTGKSEGMSSGKKGAVGDQAGQHKGLIKAGKAGLNSDAAARTGVGKDKLKANLR